MYLVSVYFVQSKSAETHVQILNANITIPGISHIKSGQSQFLCVVYMYFDHRWEIYHQGGGDMDSCSNIKQTREYEQAVATSTITNASLHQVVL